MAPKISSLFLPSNTKIPAEIQLTGREDLLEEFLKEQKQNRTITNDDMEHLEQRLENMRFLNSIQKKNAHIKYIPKPAKRIDGGFLLDSLHQKERQMTGHNCWTMPVIMMLQAHGIHLPQENVLASMPEFTKEQSKDIVENDLNMVEELSKDVNGESVNLSQLVCKLIPNVKVCERQYRIEDKSKDIRPFCEDIKKQVTESLKKEGSPVALLIPRHFRTIVGIKGDNLLLKDSYALNPDAVTECPISSLFNLNTTVSITYLRNLRVDPDQPAEDCLMDKSKYIGVDNTGKISLLSNVIQAEKENQPIENSIGTGVMLPSLISPVKLDNQVMITETEYYPQQVEQDVIEISLGKQETMTIEETNYPVIYGNEAEGFAQWNKVTLRKEEFYRDMSQSVYKDVVGLANEERQKLMYMVSHQELNMDELRNSLKILAAEQVMRAERILNNDKPGNFEKSAESPDQLYENVELLNPVVNSVLDKLGTDSAKVKVGLKEMLQQDSMQEYVKDYLSDCIRKDAKLSSDKKKHMVSDLQKKMDHSYERDRLLDLWQSQKEADPFYISSSKEFKAVKDKMNQLVELKNQMEGNSEKPEYVKQLQDKYRELYEAADQYCEMKKPSLEKGSDLAKQRYEIVDKIMDFAKEQTIRYTKQVENIKEPAKMSEQPVL